MSSAFALALLAVLQLAFLGRVLGQLAAGVWEPAGLPPFEAWQSGLLPYPWLLGAQVLILALQTRALLLVRRGAFAPRAARRLRTLARMYVTGMVLRWCATMLLFPELRWSGHAIPIVFHLVLAGWLAVLASILGTEGRGRVRSEWPAELGRERGEGTHLRSPCADVREEA